MSTVAEKQLQPTLVVATSNPGKLSELQAVLPLGLKLLSSLDFAVESPEETGQTFLDNAFIKADHASNMTNLPALADDSGLEVDALDGRPGVTSARYAGEDATDQDNNRKLIAEVAGLAAADRSARFVCVVAFRTPDGLRLSGRGTVRGRLVAEPRGANGFGYDPHFELDDPHAGCLNGRTMAELTLDEKSIVSHRRRAVEDLLSNARRISATHPFVKQLLLD